jgi:ATP-binding cassette, subfamily B, bacterial HlyB/CyaB
LRTQCFSSLPLPGDSAPALDAGSIDPALACLVVIARFHGIAADPEQIRHTSARGRTPFDADSLILSARTLNLKARAVKLRIDRLSRTPLPAIILDRHGAHFVLARWDGATALILEADAVAPRTESQEALEARAAGTMLLFASRASLAGELARFDFSWFIPAMVKYRRLLIEVVCVSLVLQLLGLVSPLLFQVIMDKVLVNRNFSTLNVICGALLVCSVFEIVLTGLRNYVFAHTTNRIDVELGTKLFRHLLALPLPYFGARRVGDTVARVRELESIRGFLTGQALTGVLDLLFSVVFLLVMSLYSIWLTLIVAASLPLYVVISALITPVLRSRLDEKFSRGADQQAFLVESVTGVHTLKAMAVEPQFCLRWENQLAAYVSASFRVSSLANVGQQAIQLIGKLISVATLFMGARLVIDGQLTVGGLIAFNMMSQRVSGPVLRLAQLWQDFQQVGISMSRLGDILNTRSELPQSPQSATPITGSISFDKVVFRYRLDGPPVLNGVDIEIGAGKVVGIVGRSGSGKSTLTKLLQRLYLPEQGAVRIDGTDLTLADPAWLRRQIGVVLQENLLFNRSVRDNIALTDNGAPMNESFKLPDSRAPTTSSQSCRKPMTRLLANRARRCQAGSDSVLLLPVH